VNLSWSASTDNVAVAGYTVYRDGKKLTTTDRTSYVDAAVAQGSTYQYTVDAFDAAGNHSAKSQSATAYVPDSKPPTAPTNLTASPKPANCPASIELSWSASTDNVGVAGYTIYRNGKVLKVVDATTTSFSDTNINLSAGSYTYAVDAFDDAANRSAKSQSATAQIVCNIP
jgi:chitin-binding protein